MIWCTFLKIRNLNLIPFDFVLSLSFVFLLFHIFRINPSYIRLHRCRMYLLKTNKIVNWKSMQKEQILMIWKDFFVCGFCFDNSFCILKSIKFKIFHFQKIDFKMQKSGWNKIHKQNNNSNHHNFLLLWCFGFLN